MKTSIYQSLIKMGSSSPYRRALLPPCAPAGAFPACASPLRRLALRTLPLLLLLLLPWLPAPTHAQDISPGIEARGYLKEKHGTVDHATGMFHYSLPLFTLTSGSFSLPVGLRYSADEIGQDAVPGMLGYGWSLHAGGMVTRTLRGGMADEATNGNAYHGDLLPWDSTLEEVNTHRLDGESDIFTALFNGRSVRFIIKRGMGEYIACPLEKTNVKIVCEGPHTGTINGWTITDETGTRYIFREAEWTKNLSCEANVSMNNVNGVSYISSWYISRIEIAGHEPLIFTYRPGNQNIIKRWQTSTWNYKYGRPVVEALIDFSPFYTELREAIQQAQNYINAEQLDLQLRMFESKTYVQTHMIEVQPGNADMAHIEIDPVTHEPSATYYSRFETQFETSELNQLMKESYHYNEKFLGILNGMWGITNLSRGMLEDLNRLIASTDNWGAKSALSSARTALSNCLNKTRMSNSKSETTTSGYRILTPLLTRIHSKQQEVLLDYNEKPYANEKYLLKQLTLQDYNGNVITTVALAQNDQQLLKSVICDGMHESFSDEQQFTYYGQRGSDTLPSGQRYKKFALQQIEYKSGGIIRLEYEKNRFYLGKNRDHHMEPSYDGLRIREMVLHSRVGSSDTIRYHYCSGGEKMYSRYNLVDTLQYGGFSDIVMSDKMMRKGNVIYETGNNGLFYPYVEEELVGIGYNTYLFFVPDGSRYTRESGLAVPQLACGLPLAQASYDRNGNLVSLQKSRYYMDGADVGDPQEFKSGYFDPEPWFDIPPAGFRNVDRLTQIKPYGFYMDRDAVRRHYLGSSVYMSYNLYDANILPREQMVLPRQDYEFFYGGKVVLKEQKEYSFNGTVSTVPSMQHLTGPLPPGGILTKDIEFIYDNPSVNTSPTRIVSRMSNGEQQVIVQRTALDIYSDDTILAQMRKANIVGIPVKTQHLVKRAGEPDFRLLSEEIKLFERFADSIILPTGSFRYTASGTGTYQPCTTNADPHLFSLDRTNYRQEQGLLYREHAGEYLPVVQSTMTDTVRYLYDRMHYPLLKVQNTEPQKIDAINFYGVGTRRERLQSFHLTPQEEILLAPYLNLLPHINDFLDFEWLFRVYDLPAAALQIRESEGFLRLTEFSLNFQFDKGVPSLKDDLHTAITDLRPLFDIYNLAGMPETLVTLYPHSKMDAFYKALISCRLWLTPEICDRYFRWTGRDLIFTPETEQETFTLSVVLQAQPGQSDFQYSIKQGDRIVATRHVAVVSGKCQALSLELDLTGVSLGTPVEVILGQDDTSLLLGVITPAGMPFEATGLSGRKLPFCRVNQNGDFEGYTYDMSGRLKMVYDRHGNLVRENGYNF